MNMPSRGAGSILSGRTILFGCGSSDHEIKLVGCLIQRNTCDERLWISFDLTASFYKKKIIRIRLDGDVYLTRIFS